MSKRKHEVSDEPLSSLMANCKKPEDLIGENGLLKQLIKLLVEKALDAEMTEHLGHDRHEPVANPAGRGANFMADVGSGRTIDPGTTALITQALVMRYPVADK